MARKDRRPQAAQHLRALLEAGDHRRARAEASALAADTAADAAEREEATAILSSLAPDRGVAAAGAVAVAIALAVTVWTIVAG
jgi:hypothetical protein